MGLLDKIILPLSLSSCVFTAWVFLYTTAQSHKPTVSNKEQLQLLKEEAERILRVQTIKFNKITTNLLSPRVRLRYVSLEIHLLPFEESDHKVLEEEEFLIYDSILKIAGKIQAEQLNSIGGKILFKKKVKDEINSRLGTPRVKKVFFPHFVIQ